MRRLKELIVVLVLLCIHSLAISPAKDTVAHGPDSSPGRPLITFIDLLSSSERFSEFLHTVQRLRLVIPLNRLRNVTLFVPTNSAIQKYRKEHGENMLVSGNVYRGISESQTWYHAVVDGVIEPLELGKGTMVWESLSHPDIKGKPVMTDDAEEPLPDHQFGVMLKTQVQSNGTVLLNEVPVLAQRYTCAAGNVYMLNGLLEIPPTIRQVLNHMETMDETTEQTDEYTAVTNLLAAAELSDLLDESINSSGGMHTLWAFSNRAFRSEFSFSERSYLLNGPKFAADDDELRRMAIADSRALATRFVSEAPFSIARLGEGMHSVPSLDKNVNLTVVVEKRGDELTGHIDGQPLGHIDIIARNGIVHDVKQIQRPESLSFNPQKALVGLNATAFVRLIKETGLSSYIDGTYPDRKVTLLAPTNHAMSEAFGYDLGDDGDDEEAGISSSSPRERQREWSQYHIVDGQYSPEELLQTPLLRTKLASKWTDERPQVVKAQVDRTHGAPAKHVSFNGADNILLEPEVIGNTTIYLLSSPMPPPPRLINALIQDLDLSLFVAAMGASNTADEIQNEAGVTVLAPVVSAFTSLGLVWSYLSLPGDNDARTDLSRLIKAHILTRPVYSDEIPLHTDSTADTLVVKALNGNEVGLYRTPHGIFVSISQGEQPPTRIRPNMHNDVASRLASISDSSSLKISEPDMLLQTGVAHILESGLILPVNVEITSAKLLRGMRAHIFTDLLERFNLTYVLKDPRNSAHSMRSSSDQNDDGDDNGDSIVGYSLLVPSDKSWRENAAYRELMRRDHENTTNFDDQNNPWRNSTTADILRHLDRLVRLHVIPIVGSGAQTAAERLPAKQLELSDRKSYPTLLDDVALRAHEFASDRFLLQLEGAPFYQAPGGAPFVSVATVVRSGIARSGAVFELDTLLRLPPEATPGPGGWKRIAWNAAVWLTGIGMGSGLLGVSGYWVRQWWTRAEYQAL
ncbi:hypothetical protein IWW36_002389 [Coemansia brasiliensis]|uniref:FAS1 domain-containing protein n=1 Tax=Coemansia brasiliensis TaxID=2650707 RepID=A0A9W8IC34_9FUNG|nr:hypothetical protein IWW36_002389 [Coemansia brasiliensis]